MVQAIINNTTASITNCLALQYPVQNPKVNNGNTSIAIHIVSILCLPIRQVFVKSMCQVYVSMLLCGEY